MAPGQYGVLVPNVAAFDERYNAAGTILVLGVYSSHLSNSGDTVDIDEIGPRASGTVAPLNGYLPSYRVDHVKYQITSPWPTQADGDGPALVRIDPADYGNDAQNWWASNVGGTPGQPGLVLDQSTPSIPANLAGQALLSPTPEISLTWLASSDPLSYVASYDIYRDGSFLGTSTTTSFVDTSAAYGTNYTYTVAAVNRDGYESSPCAGIVLALPWVIGDEPTSPTTIEICFSEPLTVSAALTKANYAVSGMTVSSVAMARNNTEVILTLSSSMTSGTVYTVNMSNLTTPSGDPLPSPLTITFTYSTIYATSGGTGSILWQYYQNISGTGVSALTTADVYANDPSQTALVTSFEAPYYNTGNTNGGETLSGYITPPTTGYYIFTLAAGDTGQLWLSSNSSPANLEEIAEIDTNTGYRDWSNVGNLDQTSTLIYLTAGTQYYIVALEKHGSNLAVSSITRSGTTATVTLNNTSIGFQNGESVDIAGAAQSQYDGVFAIAGVTVNASAGTTTFTYTVSGSPASPATLLVPGQPITAGDDNLSVRWEIPSATGGAATNWENNNSAIPIPGARLSPAGIIPDGTTPPAPANFSATVTNSNTQITLAWSPVLGLPSGVAHYNVYRNGTLDTNLTWLTATSCVDSSGISSGTRYSYQVTAVNFDGIEGVKSAAVTAVPVGIALIATPTTTSIEVQFTEPVDLTTAQTLANYTISGTPAVTITAAALQADGYTVMLTLSSSTPLGSSSYTLTISNVKTRALAALGTLTGTFSFGSAQSAISVDVRQSGRRRLRHLLRRRLDDHRRRRRRLGRHRAVPLRLHHRRDKLLRRLDHPYRLLGYGANSRGSGSLVSTFWLDQGRHHGAGQHQRASAVHLRRRDGRQRRDAPVGGIGSPSHQLHHGRKLGAPMARADL